MLLDRITRSAVLAAQSAAAAASLLSDARNGALTADNRHIDIITSQSLNTTELYSTEKRIGGSEIGVEIKEIASEEGGSTGANDHSHHHHHHHHHHHNAKADLKLRRQQVDFLQKTSFVEKNDNLPREYNTGKEIEKVFQVLAVRKVLNPLDKTIFLGILSGLFVTFAGMFTVSVAGGVPLDVRTMYPALTKLLVAVTFPIGIVFILLFGGELFTGNTMILVVAWLNKRVSIGELLLNWLVVFLSNLGAIALFVYLLAYLTGIFDNDPQHEFIVSLALRKANLPFYKMVLMGIPANALVCLAFFLGLAARDVTGKILGLYLPIACFAATGWEHCVANMFFMLTGIFYGAPIPPERFCANLFFVAIGNIIGGSIIVGGSEYYLYHWHVSHEPTRHKGNTILAKRKSSMSLADAPKVIEKKSWWKFAKKDKEEDMEAAQPDELERTS
ncbi:Formate/nitrite transporter-domain-containing protein [Cladochytrium replicatum]|nr:Formate/nitrite transporter-domain-containing protein [Cladochytrium replicatum]